MAVTVLTLQQFWIAPLGFATTLAAAEIAHFAGWVEPTGRANACPMTGAAKPIIFKLTLMVSLSLHPSCKIGLGRYLGSLATAVKNWDVSG
jgi:hypothetical protein